MLKVLLVDDEPFILQGLKVLVDWQKEGYEIAGSASLSESECLRCFHNTIGTTPIQYLKSYRIKKAAELLSNTERKIVDIGMACGFQDMSYFAKAFRGIYGCTPSEYRRCF